MSRPKALLIRCGIRRRRSLCKYRGHDNFNRVLAHITVHSNIRNLCRDITFILRIELQDQETSYVRSKRRQLRLHILVFVPRVWQLYPTPREPPGVAVGVGNAGFWVPLPMLGFIVRPSINVIRHAQSESTGFVWAQVTPQTSPNPKL